MPTILRTDPVLAVSDLSASASWYERVLGCQTHDVVPGQWAFCQNGDTMFKLGACPDAPPISELGDHSYVAYLMVDDLDAFHEAAIREGTHVSKQPTDEPWGMREMAIHSPDGHRFMLGQRLPTSGA